MPLKWTILLIITVCWSTSYIYAGSVLTSEDASPAEIEEITTAKAEGEPDNTKEQEKNETQLSEETKEYLRSKGLTDVEIEALQARGITDDVLSQAKQMATTAHNLPPLLSQNGRDEAFDTYYKNVQNDITSNAISIPWRLANKIPGTFCTTHSECNGNNEEPHPYRWGIL